MSWIRSLTTIVIKSTTPLYHVHMSNTYTSGEKTFFLYFVKQVAIKIVDTRKIKDEYCRQNLHREARILAQLRHPNIIRLYETLKVRHGSRKFFDFPLVFDIFLITRSSVWKISLLCTHCTVMNTCPRLGQNWPGGMAYNISDENDQSANVQSR